MKRRTAKAMALVLAMALMIGGSMNALACEDHNDGCVGCDGREHGGYVETIDFSSDFADTSTSSGGGSSSSESYSAPAAESYSAPDTSYDSYDYSASEGSTDQSYDASASAGSSDAGTASTGGVARNRNLVTVPGHEAWRQVSKATAGQFGVWHCGNEVYTLQLMYGESAVSYKGAGMMQAEDGRWFINVVSTDESLNYTVATNKGDKAYLPKLGISGVAVDGKVVIDVDAELAAAK